VNVSRPASVPKNVMSGLWYYTGKNTQRFKTGALEDKWNFSRQSGRSRDGMGLCQFRKMFLIFLVINGTFWSTAVYAMKQKLEGRFLSSFKVDGALAPIAASRVYVSRVVEKLLQKCAARDHVSVQTICSSRRNNLKRSRLVECLTDGWFHKVVGVSIPQDSCTRLIV